jgi:hypothetical protein
MDRPVGEYINELSLTEPMTLDRFIEWLRQNLPKEAEP